MIDGQTQIVANSSNNPIYTGAASDQFGSSFRLPDNTHFNNNGTLIDGLRRLGLEWSTTLPSSGTPISASPLQNLTVTKTGSSFQLYAPAGYIGYYWVANNDRFDNASYTSIYTMPTTSPVPIITTPGSTGISGGTNYRCYLRKSNGNIELTSTGFTSSTCAANREGVMDDFSGVEDGIGLKSYPNPSTDDFTIEFDIPYEAESVKVEFMSMSGISVKTIAQGSFAKGHYSYPMIGKELAFGTYICQLSINGTSYSTKLIKLGQ